MKAIALVVNSSHDIGGDNDLPLTVSRWCGTNVETRGAGVGAAERGNHIHGCGRLAWDGRKRSKDVSIGRRL